MKGLSAIAAGSRWSLRPSLRLSACTHLRRAASTANDRLDLQAIDSKWRRIWADASNKTSAKSLQRVDSGNDKEKYYVLPMFPYPSGTLHLGHLRVYTISDVLARYKRMKGYDVIHPMGWDAFGLPAENAAIERGIDPAEWTQSNIVKMKDQLQLMNGHWDWDREFMTCDPSFYKHTQRLFLLLHERGLAYQAESIVNWDPVECTVLANEQVDANGCSWRSGAKVEKLRLKQWFLRITDFKEALLRDLDLLAKEDRWPERVISMQRNWIGKSLGSKVQFDIEAPTTGKTYPPVEVFTTRADTLFGVQYLALSLRHPIVQDIAKTQPQLQTFIDSATKLSPDSKAGFLLPGVKAINPASSFGTSATKVQEPIPVYAAPYVLDDYGSGAVMGVPGHDNRDHAFWRENQGDKPILTVVASPSDNSLVSSFLTPEKTDQAFVHKGVLTMASGPLAGLTSEEAIDKVVKMLQEKGKFAEHTDNWRLRDWLISRQRYWGTPIPIINCDSCGPVPVPASDLPVVHPKLKEGQVLGKGGNPLNDIPEWLNTTCPKCHGPAKRETDTMDTFMDSSWYYFRFADPHNENEPISTKAAVASLPVDIYIGGVEHAILHLLYARFASKFLATTPLWPGGGGSDNNGEPFKKLITQGMVHGKTYSDPATGRFLKPEEVDLSDPANPRMVKTGEKPKISFEKMSKSKHNGVDPGACIEKYGADTTRAHILFQAPVSEVLEWDEDRIVGIQRWLNRVWRVVQRVANPTPQDGQVKGRIDDPTRGELILQKHQTIKSVTTALDTTYSLNTVISDLIKLTNALDDCAKKMGDHWSFSEGYLSAVKVLLCMMAPVTPAFAEECYQVLLSALPEQQKSRGISTSIFSVPFPEYSQEIIDELSKLSMLCSVQVDGKFKFVVEIPAPDDELLLPERRSQLAEWIAQQIKQTDEGRSLIRGSMIKFSNKKLGIAKIKSTIVVRGGRTVNFVTTRR